MEQSSIALTVSVVAIILSLTALLARPKKEDPKRQAPGFDSIPLRLQAYERLVVLAERISLPSLVSRTTLPNLSAKEMQMHLIEAVKQEFDYNVSQQIYVSPIAWDAVRNLRDQTMLIINQIANLLPHDARGTELSKKVLDVIMQQEDAALHTIVLNAINFEAKKILT